MTSVPRVAIDCDVHVAAPGMAALLPYMTQAWREMIVTRGTDGSLVTDAASLQVGDEIHTRVARGLLRAKVTGKDTGSEEQ